MLVTQGGWRLGHGEKVGLLLMQDCGGRGGGSGESSPAPLPLSSRCRLCLAQNCVDTQDTQGTCRGQSPCLLRTCWHPGGSICPADGPVCAFATSR